MKEKDVLKSLKKKSANEIKELFLIICENIFHNADFQVLIHDQFDCIKMSYNLEATIKIPFSSNDILSAEEIQILKDLYQITRENKKLLKADRIQWIYTIVTNRRLMEGLCISFKGTDTELRSLWNSIGCSKNYDIIYHDNAYRSKRQKSMLFKSYVYSTINFFGVLSTLDLYKIIAEYEMNRNKKNGNIRLDNEVKTLFYSMGFLNEYILKELISYSEWDINISGEGFLIHHCFDHELEKENYRELYQRASQYSMYLPTLKRDLFIYENRSIVYEETGLQLLDALKKECRKNIERVCKKKGMDFDIYLEDFVYNIYKNASDCRLSPETASCAMFGGHALP